MVALCRIIYALYVCELRHVYMWWDAGWQEEPLLCHLILSPNRMCLCDCVLCWHKPPWKVFSHLSPNTRNHCLYWNAFIWIRQHNVRLCGQRVAASWVGGACGIVEYVTWTDGVMTDRWIYYIYIYMRWKTQWWYDCCGETSVYIEIIV